MSLGLVLHLPVLLVLAGLHPALLPTLPLAVHGLPSVGVADGGAGSNLALSQERSWCPGVTADSLAHIWPASLGHPPGPDILPLHAILSSGIGTAHIGAGVEDEVWKVERKLQLDRNL